MNTNKFSLCKGCSISNLEGVYECYSVNKADKYDTFTVNVSSENMEALIEELLAVIRVPGFFVVEVPTNLSIEREIRKKETEPFHKETYYLDGKDNTDFLAIFQRYKELLINDGLIRFGFGSHKAYDELFIQKYKIINIFTDEPAKYELVLNKRGYQKQEQIKTVWDNISQDNPDQSESIEINDESVYDMIGNLKRIGLYHESTCKD